MAKKITVYRKLRILHLGLDPVAAPWSGDLIRALSGGRFQFVEHHAPSASDDIASRLQLYRPDFPPLDQGAGPGKLNRMARKMRGYEMIMTHGEAGFPAALAHSLFSEALKLPPLIHHHHALQGFAGGAVKRFKRRLGFARTQAVIAPTPAAANEIAKNWDVGGKRLRIALPVFGRAPKSPRPDAIPGLMKRRDEAWIGVRAADLLPDADPILRRLRDLGDEWRLVAFGSKEETVQIASLCAKMEVADRLLTSQRLAGPEDMAGLFDLLLSPASPPKGAEMPRMPFLAAPAGVPMIAAGSEIAAILPPEQHDYVFGNASGHLGAMAEAMVVLARDEVQRKRLARAMADFAAKHSDAADHRALLGEMTGDDRLYP
ncbi:glycosyltransferase [Croceicoccus marinus]|uniref:Glycosyltransferase n=1 Tax=Croceicoccus marinus TaxID=450378 RepID=A0A7G6VX39_9SPHN|nr:glycosyltransferase [Croceicoccus marinus]QNE06304.1 glycosyltransferase [Croceicoccus marinus]